MVRPQEAETGGSPVGVKPALQSKSLSQTEKYKYQK
jgi:hypothetical protein